MNIRHKLSSTLALIIAGTCVGTGTAEGQVIATAPSNIVAVAPKASPLDLAKGLRSYRTPQLPFNELINRVAGYPRHSTFVKYGGDLKAYWRVAQSSRIGKALEAVFARSENTRLAGLGQKVRVIATAAEGQAAAAADLKIVSESGKVLREIQSKMGWRNAMKALSDPKYSGMHILTDRGSLDVLTRELAKAEAKAARRGISLAKEWEVVKRALKSGRLMRQTPTGAPLPTRQAATDAARNSLKKLWPKLSRNAKSAVSVEGKCVATALVVQDAQRGSMLLRLVKSPGFVAGGMTLAIDGGIATYKYFDGQINKSELAEEIQDASIRALAVGTAVQVVYLLVATPHGLIVAGVAIVTYMAADALISHFRQEYGQKYVTVQDLKGIAPREFLENLPPTLADVARGTSPSSAKVLSDIARQPLWWER